MGFSDYADYDGLGLAQLVKRGEVSPAELDNWGRKMAASDPEMFRLVVLSRPRGSIVPVDGMPPAGGGSGSVTDELQVSINKQMGVDEETYKKFGPKKEGK